MKHSQQCFQTAKLPEILVWQEPRAMYAINHGIPPYFKYFLLSSINASDIHVYSFDDSLNEVTQTCEMDLYVRYWDVACSQIKIRYFGSSFMGHDTYTAILQHFDEITKDCNPAHLYQISMDGLNVNLKFYQEFLQKRKDENYSLIDFGSCRLHVIHGSLGTGLDDSQWWKELIDYSMIPQSAGMIMKASQGHQRVSAASVLASKIKTLGFKVTHDWLQPTDDISQQNTVGMIYLLADWLTNLWLTD